MNPINLALRFTLEAIALIAIGVWSYSLLDGFLRFVLAIGIPVVVAAIWGVFNVPGDPSRSGSAPVPVPGSIRLLIELLMFAFGAFAIAATFNILAGVCFVGAAAVHCALSSDRLRWLIKQK